MKYWLNGLLVTITATSINVAPLQAAPLEIAAPGLLPTAVVVALMEQDPAVVAARAGLEVARQDSALVKGSPYEWTATLTSQQRKLDAGGPNYREWNAALQRPLRLPTKTGVDNRIGQALLDQGDAQYGEAFHETARELLNLWLDWLHAEQSAALAMANQQSAQENLDLVQTRVTAGDASQLDASLAQGELAEQQRAGNDAKIAATVAWARLHARYPGITQEFSTLPTAVPLELEVEFWHDRIITESDELKIAQTQWLQAQATGDRMRANRLPDPTVGVFTASEFGGKESVVGVTLSMPIPGSQRRALASRSLQAAEMARQDLELVRREVEANIAISLANTQGAYESWQLAEAGATAIQGNSELMQRAYTLGEADLQALLSARRLATAAAQNALAAKVAAARAYYLLLVDAHLVWDMEHN